jgi:predicted phage terminase large subunit-like protein
MATLSAEAVRAARANPCAWARIVSGDEWLPAKHLRWLAKKLMALQDGKVRRLIVSLPPGHGKSQMISRFFPSWWLGNHPKHRVISVSMSQDLTREWSGAARDDYAAYGEAVFGTTASARASATKWRLFDPRTRKPTGGSLFGVGIGGAVTGRRANGIVIDDTVRDMAAAENEAQRNAHYVWLKSVAIPRLLPGGWVVIVMTRWHHDDVIGRLIKEQEEGGGGHKWEVVNVPAICDEPETDPLGRKEGEAIWPEMYPVEDLAITREEVGPIVWNSLYMGRPTSKTGGFFQQKWYRWYDRAGDKLTDEDGNVYDARTLRRYATVDLAISKKESADYTAMGAWGAHPRKLFLLDVLRERLEGPEIVPRMRSFLHLHGLRVAFVEAMAFQKAIIQFALLSRLPVREIEADQDKVSRALPATALFEGGILLLPRAAPWLAAYLLEMSQFPSGEKDDQVDMTSYGAQVYQRRFMALSKGRASRRRGRPRREEGDQDEDRNGGRGGDEWVIGR